MKYFGIFLIIFDLIKNVPTFISWLHLLTIICTYCISEGLIFREDQFTDLTQDCVSDKNHEIHYILNEDNPARYLSVDPSHPIKALRKKVHRGRADPLRLDDPIHSLSAKDIESLKHATWTTYNRTFNCIINIQTTLPTGSKTKDKYDALSLMIVELNYSQQQGNHHVQISTTGHRGNTHRRVTKVAHYSDRIWASTNPNFLLSGQLSGFDSIDYRTKVDSQHLIKPEALLSTFDKPASITVNITKWAWTSHIYMVFTSYKYLKSNSNEKCQENKEFDCNSQPVGFLNANINHLCMSVTLACDGLPNCGQDYLPNSDENCFKIHWSSVLLSLVSYILLAITLLLCLSCFARVLIQWSVRSSLAELRGVGTPVGSFRSSSRFFSFLGTTFSSRWDRPPPTYDEAMKHVNPDIARPQAPPTYDATIGGDSGNNLNQQFGGGSGIVETPPPEYASQEGLHNIDGAIGGEPILIQNTSDNLRASLLLNTSPSHGTAAGAESLGAAAGSFENCSDMLSPTASIFHNPTVVVLPPTPGTDTHSISISCPDLNDSFNVNSSSSSSCSSSTNGAASAIGVNGTSTSGGTGKVIRHNTTTVEAEVCAGPK